MPNSKARKPKISEEHKEAFYQAKILDWLKKNYPDGFFWKAQQGPYSRKGIPDICAIINGHFFGFEVKRPGEEPTKIQGETISKMNRAGGTALAVTTTEQVRDAIREWESREMARCRAAAKKDGEANK